MSGEPGQQSNSTRIKHLVLGAPRNINDPKIFHKIALIPLLAWIGLGADGLSSSSYGPEEAFRALGEHTYLALFLALATALRNRSTSRHFIVGSDACIIMEHDEAKLICF